jgi:hypothetical protein
VSARLYDVRRRPEWPHRMADPPTPRPKDRFVCRVWEQVASVRRWRGQVRV